MQINLIKGNTVLNCISFVVNLPTVPRVGEKVSFKMFDDYIIGAVEDVVYTNDTGSTEIIVKVA